jgi:hypothetical protein
MTEYDPDRFEYLAGVVARAYRDWPPRSGQRATEVYEWPKFAPEMFAPRPDDAHFVRRFYVAPNGIDLYVNGRPVFLDQMRRVTHETGEAYEVQATTGGRRPGSSLAGRRPEMLAMWQRVGPDIRQEALAARLQVQPVTVRRYFGGAWATFRRTGELPD